MRDGPTAYEVIAPRVPGAQPGVRATFGTLTEAREYALDWFDRRPDLRRHDVRIERNGVFVEYTGPAR